MNFNKHANLSGTHAFLSASKHHWVNYDDKRLKQAYVNFLAAQKGTELHEFAAKCIELGIRIKSNNKTLNSYVNDAIGFKMTPEQPLYYSDNCYGTCDSIAFRNDILRIHDLKTGKLPTSMDQLYIYVALFCLEYGIKPGEIQIETRIYQNGDVATENPTASDILPIMDKIKRFDKIIERIKEKG